jgi:hypothetical protein
MHRSFFPFFKGAVFSVLGALTLSSCKKLIEVPLPEDQIAASTIFSNTQDATTAILGVYISIMDNTRSLLNGSMSLYGGLSSDEISRTSALATEDAFSLNALTDQNPLCSNLYTAGYNWIYDCNNILDKLSGSSGIDDNTKGQLSGEARFTRALIYFYLVNLYGDVPLVTTTDYVVNAVLPRTSSALVYQQIVEDLTAAQQALPDQYGNTNDPTNNRTRPSRSAATALLARVYLYEGEWALAEQESNAVIDNPMFQLEMDPDKTFLSSSPETIWQLQPVHATIGTAEGHLFISGSSTRPVYVLTDWLLNSFEPGDLRLSHWTAAAVNDTHSVYPFKYKLVTDIPANQEYDIVLRLSEQYLIRAEARAQQDKQNEAIADLDIVRHRAGLPATTVTEKASLLTAIGHERRIEFFAEWGHRWLDLKRTGQIDAVLTSEKTGWKRTAALYPIPYTELAYNPNMVQNQGY